MWVVKVRAIARVASGAVALAGSPLACGPATTPGDAVAIGGGSSGGGSSGASNAGVAAMAGGAGRLIGTAGDVAIGAGAPAGGTPVAGGEADSRGGGSASGGITSGAGAASGGLPSMSEGGSGDTAGTTNLEPPKPDKNSTLPIAAPGSGYVVEGNLPYGTHRRQRLDILYPKQAGPSGNQTLPGVIMFHGGGWIQGDKATMSSFYSRFLSHGFVVCTVEYRVADSSANGAIAPAAVEDALLAAKWFWSYMDYYHVDRARYVVTGASAGGHLALMVGMATPQAMLGPTSPGDYRIAAIVNGYGPTDVADLLKRGTSFAVQWLPSGTPDRDALAKRSSPVTYARKDIPPLITVHGDQDNTVPVAQAKTLDALLQAAGADAELHWVAGAGHGFGSPSGAWADAEKAMFGFLTAHGIGK